MKRVWGVLMLMPALSWADTSEQMVYAKCEEGESIEVVSFDLFGEAQQQWDRFGLLQYHSYQSLQKNLHREHRLSCRVAGRTIDISFHMDSPRERGECGGQPGGWISVSQDGQPILGATMNNYCYQSLDAVVVRRIGSELEYKFCGDGSSASFALDGCLTFSQKQFDHLKLPLSSFPISDLISTGQKVEP